MTRNLDLVNRPPPVRWPVLITAMQDAGFSLRQIGAALRITHSTVQKWQKGAIPNYEDGRALLALFEAARPYLPEPVRIS